MKEFPIVLEDEEKKVEISVSIGVTFSKTGESNMYEKMYRNADIAMYRAKQYGKAVLLGDKKGTEVVVTAQE